jgi:membrane protein
MIIIVISILGMLFGKQSVSSDIVHQLSDTVGVEAATQIQNIIRNQHIHHNHLLTTIVGFATLILGTSGMLSQVHNALNAMWDIKAKPKNSIVRYLKKHLLSFSVLILLFFTMLATSAISSFLIKFKGDLHPDYELLYLYEHLVSFFVITTIFFIIFKSLSDAKVHWKVALWGSLFTGTLFMLGKLLIAYIVGNSHLNTTFGSASVLAIIMLWVYYTSQIIFLGSSFIKLLSKKLNLPIVPKSQAVLVETVELQQ